MGERCLGERDVICKGFIVAVVWDNDDCADDVRKMWLVEESPYEKVYLGCLCEDNLVQEVILAARTPSRADESRRAPCLVAVGSYPLHDPGVPTSVDNLLADINRKTAVVHTCPEWGVDGEGGRGHEQPAALLARYIVGWK